MDAGDLVPDEVVIGMIREGLTGRTDDFMLDGFPRTIAQAEALDAMLAGVGAPIDAVISFEVPRDELVRRLGGRWICRGCGKSFHEVSNPYGGESCSAGGQECDLYQRDDDRPEAVANRLDVYDAQTSPLIEYYESRGLLRRVDGALSLDEVQAQVVEAIA
jgi:adenylate kinase